MPKPTDAWVRWLFVPALVFIAQATSTTYLADFWHHLARGRVIVEEGRLLDHDIFTFTVPGQAFQDVNWLTQVFYYLLYEQGGLALVTVVNALALALTMAIIVGHCRRAAGSLGVAAGVGVLVFLGLWQVLTIRPQTFSLLLFALLYDLLDRSKERPGLAWLALPIMALWANLHGAFPAGLMLLGCFLAAEVCNAFQSRDRQGAGTPVRSLTVAALALAGGFLATLLNPYGWHIYEYVGLTANTAGMRRIDEWLPPTLDQGIGVAWLASMVLMAGLLVAAWQWRGVRPSVQDLWLIVMFLPLACGSARMVAWWLVISAPIVAQRLTLWRPTQPAEEKPTLGAAVSVLLLGLAMLLSLPGWHRFNPLLALRSPARTEHDLDQVRAHLDQRPGSGRLFCRFEWGEYLSWAFHPRYTVFMDGRIEIYPDPVWAGYSAVTCGQDGWAAVLEAYGVQALVLDETYHRRTGLLTQIEQDAQWRRTFQAGSAVVFELRSSEPRPSGSDVPIAP